MNLKEGITLFLVMLTRQIKMEQINLNDENTGCDPTAMVDSFNL